MGGDSDSDAEGGEGGGSDSDQGSYVALDAPDVEAHDGRSYHQERRAYRSRRQHWKVNKG